jgi:hypothetical protein
MHAKPFRNHDGVGSRTLKMRFGWMWPKWPYHASITFYKMFTPNLRIYALRSDESGAIILMYLELEKIN